MMRPERNMPDVPRPSVKSLFKFKNFEKMDTNRRTLCTKLQVRSKEPQEKNREGRL